MYLFQRISSLDAWHALANLHSTMYLFQPTFSYNNLVIGIIYIPLCIYFNPQEISAGLSGYNLHSTMYLFQLYEETKDKLNKAHLHSTMYLFQLKLDDQHELVDYIYIPLCIYFNNNVIIHQFQMQ